MPSCKYCGEPFTTAANVQKHQSQARDCLKKVEEEFQEISRLRRERRANGSRLPFSACGNTDFGPTAEAETEVEMQLPSDNILVVTAGQEQAETELHGELVIDWDATAPRRMVEVEDEDVYSRNNVKRTAFPIKDGSKPGHAYNLGKTAFQSIRDVQIHKNDELLGSFKDNAEWELAKWLITNVGHAQADTLLKLPIVSQSYILHKIQN
jgi:hypothetical protein